MKFTATKRELLSLCFHVIGSQRQWTPEQSAQRLKAWDELGVRDLALDLSDMLAVQGMGLNPGSAWMDRKAEMEADITIGTLTFLIAQLKTPIATEHVDHLLGLRDRLTVLAEAK
jgi:hypothetical protein